MSRRSVSLPLRTKIIGKQEDNIPIGCVSPACHPYVFWWLPLCVTTSGNGGSRHFVNKFQQVSCDDHQMSVAGRRESRSYVRGGTLPCDLSNDLDILPPNRITSFADGNNFNVEQRLFSKKNSNHKITQLSCRYSCFEYAHESEWMFDKFISIHF